MKRIGVIIPAYNSEKYIDKCLMSILNQSINDAQVIVVNDGSTDKTLGIIEDYKKIFVENGFDYKIISLKKNEGQASCFNDALPLLKSEYFMWLDSDDFLYPECFKKKISFLDTHPELDLCLCDGEYYEWPNYKKTIGILEKKNKINDFFEQLLCIGDVVWEPGSVCVRTSFLFERIRNKTIYPSREGQNIQLLLPIFYKSHYAYMNEILYGVVIHHDSHSRQMRSLKEQIKRQNEIYIIYKKSLTNIDMSKFLISYYCCFPSLYLNGKIKKLLLDNSRRFLAIWFLLKISFILLKKKSMEILAFIFRIKL